MRFPFLPPLSPLSRPGKATLFLTLLACSPALMMTGTPAWAEEETAATFDIQGFIVEGNTLLPDRPLNDDPNSPLKGIPTIQSELEGFIGTAKTVDDIEKARASLEETYHKQGYPTVLVNIPEQTLENGMVRLEITESTIRRVRVTGNEYYTMDNILTDMPTLRQGEVLNLPHLQEELKQVNRSTDLRVEPALTPGKEFGTVDVELKVKDSRPLHGSLELNNRNSYNTTDLRLSGAIRYDNLWQQDHSVSAQFQVSPQDTDEVQVLSASYILPSPWHDDHRLALYSVWSDSVTRNISILDSQIGSGFIFGTRYVIPLQPVDKFSHSLSLGFDYKDSEDTSDTEFDSEKKSVTYLPWAFAYNGYVTANSSTTRFNLGVNLSFRDLVSEEEEFAAKRDNARADYIYLNAGVEHERKLPWDTGLFVKLEGQLADQQLISNEQFSAGGMESVRGYFESSSSGDNAVHAVVELRGPDMAARVPVLASIPFQAIPFVFYDIAYLSIIDPTEEEDAFTNIQGTGLGLRGSVSDYLDYETAMAWALRDKVYDIDGDDNAEAGDTIVYFKMKSKF